MIGSATKVQMDLKPSLCQFDLQSLCRGYLFPVRRKHQVFLPG